MFRNALPLLLAAAALAACSASSSSITLSGRETLTFETSAGGDGLPGCPAADGAVSDSKVVLDLFTRFATRTIETVACTGQSGSASALPRATTATSLIASPAQVGALVNAIEATSSRHIAECAEDGNIDWLTVDRGGGVKDVYDDDLGNHCPPVVGTIATADMTRLFALASAPFLVNAGCPMPDGTAVACTCGADGTWESGCGMDWPMPFPDAGTPDAEAE